MDGDPGTFRAYCTAWNAYDSACSDASRAAADAACRPPGTGLRCTASNASVVLPPTVLNGTAVPCNRTVVAPCPAGYYCPTSSTQVSCPRGHFCRVGVPAPSACLFGALGCPAPRMASPRGPAVAAALLAVLVAVGWAYASLSAWFLRSERHARLRSLSLSLPREGHEQAGAADTESGGGGGPREPLLSPLDGEEGATPALYLSPADRVFIAAVRRHQRDGVDTNPASAGACTDLDSLASGAAAARVVVTIELDDVCVGLRDGPVRSLFANPPPSSCHCSSSCCCGSGGGGGCPAPPPPVQLLQHVTARFDGGRLHAVLGLSAAGKTTLLTLLRGQAALLGPVRVTGRVHVHCDGDKAGDDIDIAVGVGVGVGVGVAGGKAPGSASASARGGYAALAARAWSGGVAYVPQDDASVLYDDLTVEENVLFAAMLFRGASQAPTATATASASAAELAPVVQRTLAMLDLTAVAGALARAGDGGGRRRPPLCRVGNAPAEGGGAGNAGISGGQRRRCSVAVEMMRDAPVFLCDEPTSGQDAATSQRIVDVLHHLARRRGTTVIATLHQPRAEIFNRLDSVLLLAPGGRVAFQGPPAALKPHLLALGFTHGASGAPSNVADWAMDVVSGLVPRAPGAPGVPGGPGGPGGQGVPGAPGAGAVAVSASLCCEYLCRYWQIHGPHAATPRPPHPAHPADRTERTERPCGAAVAPATSPDTTDDTATTSRPPSVAAPPHGTPATSASTGTGGSRQAWTCAWGGGCAARTFSASFLRQHRVLRRSLPALGANCAVLFLLGGVIALLFGTVTLDSQAGGGGFVGQVSSMQLAFALVIVSSSLPLFARDSAARQREAGLGLPLAPYYVGKLLGQSLLEVVALPLAFLCAYYALAAPLGAFADYWGVVTLLCVAVMGLANLVAVVVPAGGEGAGKGGGGGTGGSGGGGGGGGGAAGVVANGLVVLLWSFGGISPSLATLTARLGPIGAAAHALSPFTYAFEMHIRAETAAYPPSYSHKVAAYMGTLGYMYAPGEAGRTVGLLAGRLVAHAVVTNSLAALWLVADAARLRARTRSAAH